ncbi:MAG: chemotaxis protein CheW [Sulfuricurvum sp.]|nr:chemotaxis protein CheW [Sulfuricurvum sp.]
MSNDYIVFTVSNNYYAIEVAWVERIIQIPSLTTIPNAHPYIEGMMSYEKRVTKVVSFRKMTDLPPYQEELNRIFEQVKIDHQFWVESLKKALREGSPFTLTTDPHACRLGKWLDNYSTHDSEVLAVLKVLRPIHAQLHEIGKVALELRQTDPEKALHIVERDISQIFHVTMGQIEKMIHLSGDIAAHLQKLLIYRKEESFFAIIVDTIEDMARIDLASLKHVDDLNQIGSFLEIEGVVEIGEKLVNVIKTVSLPIREVA